MSVRALVLCAALLPALAAAQGNRCPNVLLVFDASGSMGATVSGANKDRYTVGREAVASLLSANTQNFRYGLEMFGLDVGGDICSISSPTCDYPNPSTCDSVQCEYSTAQRINTVLNLNGPDGLTPTGPAVSTALQRADMKDATRKRYLVLITDGDPYGCSSTDNDYPEAISALTQARNAGIKTYVLGFAGGTPENLNAMAQAGGTARNAACTDTQPCYYNASNASELNAALQAIVNAVGGELGGAACDDSCYAVGGCPAGSICKAGACTVDPCAGVTCGAGSSCVEGQCLRGCAPACAYDEVCDNGVCLKDSPCAQPCTARNAVCIGGSCREDYCSGNTYTLACNQAAGELCVKNACQSYTAPTVDAGTGGGGGADGGRPGGGTITTEAVGCCSGAPDAFSGFGLLAALSAFAARRRPRG
ncbi:MAG: hypothetical protein RL653_1808 [Pseudomonadota bacterium]|jgi:hypothetical protein